MVSRPVLSGTPPLMLARIAGLLSQALPLVAAALVLAASVTRDPSFVAFSTTRIGISSVTTSLYASVVAIQEVTFRALAVAGRRAVLVPSLAAPW